VVGFFILWICCTVLLLVLFELFCRAGCLRPTFALFFAQPRVLSKLAYQTTEPTVSLAMVYYSPRVCMRSRISHKVSLIVSMSISFPTPLFSALASRFKRSLPVS